MVLARTILKMAIDGVTKKNKFRSMVTILSVAIGLATIAGVNIAVSDVTAFHFREFLEKSPADYVVSGQNLALTYNGTRLLDQLMAFDQIIALGSLLRKATIDFGGSLTTFINVSVKKPQLGYPDINSPMLIGITGDLFSEFKSLDVLVGNLEEIEAPSGLNQSQLLLRGVYNVFITEDMAANYRLNVGDRLNVTIRWRLGRDIQIHEKDFYISGILRPETLLISYFDHRYDNSIFLDLRYLQAFFNESVEMVSETWIKVNRSSLYSMSPDEALQEVNLLGNQIRGRIQVVGQLVFEEPIKLALEEYIEWLISRQIILTVFSLFPVVLSSYVMMTSAGLAIRVRAQEFSRWAARGMTKRGMISVILLESTFLAIFGIILGLVMSSYFSMIYQNVLPELFGEGTSVSDLFNILRFLAMPPIILVGLIVLTFLLSILPTLLPLSKIESLTITEAMKFSEARETVPSKWKQMFGFLTYFGSGGVSLAIAFSTTTTIDFSLRMLFLVIGALLIYLSIYRLFSWKFDAFLRLSDPYFRLSFGSLRDFARRFLYNKRHDAIRIMFFVGLAVGIIATTLIQANVERQLVLDYTEFQVGSDLYVELNRPLNLSEIAGLGSVEGIRAFTPDVRLYTFSGAGAFTLHALNASVLDVVFDLKSQYFYQNQPFQFGSVLGTENYSLIITETVMQSLGGVNQEIFLNFEANLHPFLVKGVIRTFPGIADFIKPDTLVGITNLETLNALNLTQSPFVTGIFIKLVDINDAIIQDVTNGIKEFFQTLNIIDLKITVLNDELNEALKSNLNLAFSSFLMVLSVFVVIQVFIASILLGLQIVQERQKTLGILRARGMSRLATAWFLIKLFFFPIMLSMVLGTAVGFFLASSFNNFRRDVFQYIQPTIQFPLAFPFVLLSLIVIFTISLAIPALIISLRPVTAALKASE